MAGQGRQRSQRKASSLATAAISLQSSDSYVGAGHVGLASSTSSGQIAQAGGFSRPLTIRERQLIDEEQREKDERERQAKRRKIRKRLDELERTNPRDSITSARSGADSTSRNDGDGLSIPNSALEAAAARRVVHGSSNSSKDPREVPMAGGGPSDASGGSQRKQSAAVRRLLNYRRGYYALLEDASADPIFATAKTNYNGAVPTAAYASAAIPAVASGNFVVHAYPSKARFCSVCSGAGTTSCPRCADRTCSRSECLATHNDTRCDRPIR